MIIVNTNSLRERLTREGFDVLSRSAEFDIPDDAFASLMTELSKREPELFSFGEDRTPDDSKARTEAAFRWITHVDRIKPLGVIPASTPQDLLIQAIIQQNQILRDEADRRVSVNSTLQETQQRIGEASTQVQLHVTASHDTTRRIVADAAEALRLAVSRSTSGLETDIAERQRGIHAFGLNIAKRAGRADWVRFGITTLLLIILILLTASRGHAQNINVGTPNVPATPYTTRNPILTNADGAVVVVSGGTAVPISVGSTVNIQGVTGGVAVAIAGNSGGTQVEIATDTAGRQIIAGQAPSLSPIVGAPVRVAGSTANTTYEIAITTQGALLVAGMPVNVQATTGLTSTAVTVVPSSQFLVYGKCVNPDTANLAYAQVFDSASVAVGSTGNVDSIPIPPLEVVVWPIGRIFTNSIKVAATTTVGGGTTAVTAIHCWWGYRAS